MPVAMVVRAAPRLVPAIDKWPGNRLRLNGQGGRPDVAAALSCVGEILMRRPLATLFSFLLFAFVVTAQQPAPPAGQLAGRWRVTFSITGDPQKHLIFESKANRAGSFSLLDTGPKGTAVADPLPAAWSELTNNRVSFSGEVELPVGNCCREIGTLIFKGKFDSANSISGKLIFVTSVDEEESAYKFHSAVGTFTATRI